MRFVQQGPNHGCTRRLESVALRQNSRRCGRIYSYSRGTAENGELSIDKAADVEQARPLHARAASFAAAALGLLNRQITPPTSSLPRNPPASPTITSTRRPPPYSPSPPNQPRLHLGQPWAYPFPSTS